MAAIWTAVLHLWAMFAGGTGPAYGTIISEETYSGLLPEVWTFSLSFEPLLFGLALVVLGVVAFVGFKMVGIIKGLFA